VIRRWTFNTTVVVSLLLGIAAVASGVLSLAFGLGCSLTRYDATPETGGMVTSIMSAGVYRGRLFLRTTWVADSWKTIRDENMGFQHGYEWSSFDPSAFRKPDFEILGFGYYRIATATAGFDQSVRRGVVIPIWFVVLMLAVIPWIGWRKLRRRRLLARNQVHLLCRGCGYNLTGNTSGVCPECGMPVPSRLAGIA
jgi:hypothetical protein